MTREDIAWTKKMARSGFFIAVARHFCNTAAYTACEESSLDAPLVRAKIPAVNKKVTNRGECVF